jgi:pyrophosphatase PpaX
MFIDLPIGPLPEPAGPFRTVLFDIDGTLIDTAELIADSLDYACRRHLGAPRPRSDYYVLIGKPAIVQMQLLGAGMDRLLATAMLESAIAYYEDHAEREQPFPGALDALAQLSEMGIRLALVTSKLRRELDPTLERVPLQQYARVIITSDLTTRPKPFPDPVYLALQTLQIGADEALFIGDSPYDLQCGRAAGVRTGAVTWGPHPREVLAAEAPDHLFESFGEILRLCGVHSSGETGV